MAQTTIRLHPKQFAAYDFRTQFGCVVCGVQSGKTFLGAVWANRKINEYPKGNGLICAPNYKVLSQSTMDKFFLVFPEYRRFYRQQAQVIELPTGGKIFIRSADDPLGVEGMTINWAWLDEAGMMKRMMWLVAKARVSTTSGQILLTTTPYNMGWLYQDLVVPAKEGTDPDVSFFTWKSVENPYFPKDFYDKEKARLRPEEFSRRYEGEFTRLEGLVWDVPPSAVIRESPLLGRVRKFPDTVVGGIDWGFNHPTGIVVAYAKDGCFYVVDEWREKGKTTSEIVEKVKELTSRHGVRCWYPDPAEPDRIEEMKRHGLRVGLTNKDVPLGLSHVQSLLREGRLFVLDSCERLLQEMSEYCYEASEDGDTERPLKVNDDLCDPLRYLCMGHRPSEPRKSNFETRPRRSYE